MAKRRFELPGVHELSKEQEAILALPSEGQHLIIGGPGTGKTVVALLRARAYERAPRDYIFLAFNHLLLRLSEQLSQHELKAETRHRWFWTQFREITGREVPLLPSENHWKPEDWERVLQIADETPSASSAPFLVIDEGQDMPPEFYRALVALGFKRFFVAADQNQQITEQHSSRQDIETELAIEASAVHELHYNYRNSVPIARLADAFYTGDPASPRVSLPRRHGIAPRLVDYPENRFGDICRRVVKEADRDPSRLIGVIAPNDEVRGAFFRKLRGVADNLDLDHGKPHIETFHSKRRPPGLRFDEGGILVINAQACKGQEFDVAILADINEYPLIPTNADATRKVFYVMLTRARERVILLRRSDRPSRIDDILPDDGNVLRREVL